MQDEKNRPELKKMDFPEPIINAITALSSEERRKILLLLKQREGLSFSEINESVKDDIVKGTLTYHLNKLENAGLVTNYFNPTLAKEPYHSYYRVTSLCESLVNSIFSAYEGQKEYCVNALPSSTGSSGTPVLGKTPACTYPVTSTGESVNECLSRTPYLKTARKRKEHP